MEELCLPVCSTTFFTPRDGTTQSGQGPPTSINNLENMSQPCPQANLRFSLLRCVKLTRNINCHTLSAIPWNTGTSLIGSITLPFYMPTKPAPVDDAKFCYQLEIYARVLDICPIAAVYGWVPVRLNLENINLATPI